MRLMKTHEKEPPSDTDTHLTLYKAFPTLGGIVHTQSSRPSVTGTLTLIRCLPYW